MENKLAMENCLLVFRNKKINEFDGTQKILDICASNGYYFEKTSFVAYDNPTEIVSALKDGVGAYDNLLLYCPDSMEKVLKDFLSDYLKVEFDDLNVLKSDNKSVYLITFCNDLEKRIEYFCTSMNKKYGVTFYRAYVKCVGAPLSVINSSITKAKQLCPPLTINVKEKYGDCSVEIVYDNSVGKAEFDAAYRELVAGLTGYIYALDDSTLAGRLVDLLKLRRMVVGVAESFTGGGVGKKLVEISGVSEVYSEGLNTYSNEAKIARLGVSEETLKSFGAVSKETAMEMAQGLLKCGRCNFSIATTGIAGPKSDNTQKPVGLVYIAVGVDGNVKVFEYNLKGSRNEITETAINLALFLAFKTLK